MKTQRRAGHYKRKAPKGAYSDSYGPRIGRLEPTPRSGIAGPPPGPTGPMLHGMPLQGFPAVPLIRDRESIRR